MTVVMFCLQAFRTVLSVELFDCFGWQQPVQAEPCVSRLMLCVYRSVLLWAA